MSNHGQKLLELFDEHNDKDEEQKNYDTPSFDRITAKKSSASRRVRLGKTGKFYCGGRLEP